MNDKWIDYAIKIQSIAQTGLQYCKDEFDKERYEELRKISAEMVSAKTDISLEKIYDLFCNESGKFEKNIETTETALFTLDEIPPNLATEKCTKEQIQMCFSSLENPNLPTEFE